MLVNFKLQRDFQLCEKMSLYKLKRKSFTKECLIDVYKIQLKLFFSENNLFIELQIEKSCICLVLKIFDGFISVLEFFYALISTFNIDPFFIKKEKKIDPISMKAVKKLYTKVHCLLTAYGTCKKPIIFKQEKSIFFYI